MTRVIHGEEVVHGLHFQRLVEHCARFSDAQRRKLAEIYGAPGSEPDAIAFHWCAHREDFLDVLRRRIRSAAIWSALEEVVFEHDYPVPDAWLEKKHRQRLAELGLISPGEEAQEGGATWSLPGALAAVLASKLRGARGSLPILLGQRDPEEIKRLAAVHAINVNRPTVFLILALCDRFAQQGFIEELLSKLDQPELITPALMVLELGGVAYWQEIFRFNPENGADYLPNVVPLMRRGERQEEKVAAEQLLEMGVIFQLQEQGIPYELVAVPEELWGSLWHLGRDWLAEWTAAGIHTLRAEAARALQAQPGQSDMQHALKWLVCEADAGHFEAEIEDEQVFVQFDDAVQERYRSDDFTYATLMELAQDLNLWSHENQKPCINESLIERLDWPRAQFVRQVLADWCMGGVGRGVDEKLPKAIGLDEAWRNLVLTSPELAGFLPHWMDFEGVPHERTGAGSLRVVEESMPDMLAMEATLVHGYIWNVKMHFLDSLSLLDTDSWYPISALLEQLQLTASFVLFEHLQLILQQPGQAIYLPVQRASLLADPGYLEWFQAWLEDIIDHLWVPLGVATRTASTGEEPGQLVRLDTRSLRLDTLPVVENAMRIEAMRSMLNDPDLVFEIPQSASVGLRAVPAVEDEGDLVSLDVPVSQLRRTMSGRDIVAFEGRNLRTLPARS